MPLDRSTIFRRLNVHLVIVEPEVMADQVLHRVENARFPHQIGKQWPMQKR